MLIEQLTFYKNILMMGNNSLFQVEHKILVTHCVSSASYSLVINRLLNPEPCYLFITQMPDKSSLGMVEIHPKFNGEFFTFWIGYLKSGSKAFQNRSILVLDDLNNLFWAGFKKSGFKNWNI